VSRTRLGADVGSRSRFVVAEMHGRLGSQLFEYASCYAVARRRGVDLKFVNGTVADGHLLLADLLGPGYREVDTWEKLSVGLFPWKLPFPPAWQALTSRVVDLLRRVVGRGPSSVERWLPASVYQPDLFDLDLPVRIRGHLQSEKYFEQYADDLMASLRWPNPRPALPEGIGSSIAVSFRRGDYNSLDWTLPLSYYDEAIELVLAKFPDSTLVFFGDDSAFIELAIERYARLGRTLNALDVGRDPISQLALMAACDHCIISNSSFAWWGAWLGDRMHPRGDRVVVSPREYGEEGDRVPERWLTLRTGSTVF
jgi:Glycosyl transferase family 11